MIYVKESMIGVQHEFEQKEPGIRKISLTVVAGVRA